MALGSVARVTALGELRAREGEVAAGIKYRPEIGIRVVRRKESGAKSAAVVDRALEPAPLSKWRWAHMARVTALGKLRAREGEVVTSTTYHPELGIRVVRRKESGAKYAAVVDRALEIAPFSHPLILFGLR